MSTQLSSDYPKWIRDIDATLPVTASYVIHGNVRDLYLVPSDNGRKIPQDIYATLWNCLSKNGFEALLIHTPDKMQILPAGSEGTITQNLGIASDTFSNPVGPDNLRQIMTLVVNNREHRYGLVIDYSSQWQPNGEPPSTSEHLLMRSALFAIHHARPANPPAPRSSKPLNVLLWILDNSADLPSWLTSGFEGIRQIAIGHPDRTERTEVARTLIPLLPGNTGNPSLTGSENSAETAETFAARTEGMGIRAMNDIMLLARDQEIPAARIADAVRAYRVGLVENPWERPAVRDAIRHGEAQLNTRVRGQERAIRHALDILIRSNMGLTGAERGGSSGGPRGILFFAGPTGVGKTELTKGLAELIFGREDAMIRFDMSEFAAEHNEARLIGSPPGYIGHGQGGELTSAIRQRPFSLVLFDEIEKAHPRILDKFLQILSDGRLTDGSGDTVHFDETLIVFTSNLGVPELAEGETPPAGAELEHLIRTEIQKDFTQRLDRPELLGRIGIDNVVVFDYINPEIARELAQRFINNVVTAVEAKHGVHITIPNEVMNLLVNESSDDLSAGARGITRAVENNVLNPISRALFSLPPGTRNVTLLGIEEQAGGWLNANLQV